MNFTMTVLTLHSPAKINLSLRILGRRPDGFHEIQTTLCRIALHDTIEIRRNSSVTRSVDLTCSDPAIPLDETNLALRAVRLFEKETGTEQSCTIHLEKRIPAGAGLGGGSSNAAAVLQGLNQMTGGPIPPQRLLSISACLGSDVPFFLLNTAAGTGTGRGEIVTPIPFPWELPLVLIKPPFPIPTPWAYQRWASSRELHGIPYAPQICPWGQMLNDLERPVFEKHLLLPALKTQLLGSSHTLAALMSGSGSTMFAITRTAVAAENLAAQAREWCGDTALVHVTHTMSDGVVPP